MKKWLAALLGLAMAASLCISALGAPSGGVEVTADRGSVKAGESVVLLAVLKEPVTAASMGVSIQWDEKAFAIDSAEWQVTGALLKDFKLDKGQGVLAFSSPKEVSGAVMRLVLTAKAGAPVGSSPMTVTVQVKNGSDTIKLDPVTVTVQVADGSSSSSQPVPPDDNPETPGSSAPSEPVTSGSSSAPSEPASSGSGSAPSEPASSGSSAASEPASSGSGAASSSASSEAASSSSMIQSSSTGASSAAPDENPGSTPTAPDEQAGTDQPEDKPTTLPPMSSSTGVDISAPASSQAQAAVTDSAKPGALVPVMLIVLTAAAAALAAVLLRRKK